MDTAVSVKLKKIVKFRRYKTQKHSVSIGLYCFDFFMNILTGNLPIQFLHIPNRMMRLSKKIFYQYFVGFLPCLGQLLLSELFVSLHSTNNLKET